MDADSENSTVDRPPWIGSPEEEKALLNRILVEGFDQGCFIRPTDDELVPLGQAESALDEYRSREDVRYDQEDPYSIDLCPQRPISGSEPGYVILSQRCDLISQIKVEPVVELARAWLETEARVLSMARKNSSRLVYLCEDESSDGGWVVDLRRRAFISKHCLTNHEAILPISGKRARRDFAQRVGRRFSRDAIPEDVVMGFQRPLVEWIGRSTSRLKESQVFSEVIVYRGDADGELVVLALIDEDREIGAAESIFHAWLKEMEQKVLFEIAPESGVLTADDIPLGLWKDAYKIDLDFASRGKHADEETALPNR